MPKNLTNKEGQRTGAVKGVINILMSDIRKTEATHCAFVFDRKGKNFRSKLYPEYKAGREHSDSPRDQIRPLRHILKAMGVSVWGQRGIEGDDITGSIATRCSELGALAVISSGDKDFHQLIADDKIHILPPKGEPGGEEVTIERLGIKPSQVIEYLMMLGDSVDNIPGVDKCGPKTAVKLLTQYGTLKRILRHLDTLGPALREKFEDSRGHFDLTRKLITIDTGLYPDLRLDDLRFAPLNRDELAEQCERYGLRTTHKQILYFFKGS